MTKYYSIENDSRKDKLIYLEINLLKFVRRFVL